MTHCTYRATMLPYVLSTNLGTTLLLPKAMWNVHKWRVCALYHNYPNKPTIVTSFMCDQYVIKLPIFPDNTDEHRELRARSYRWRHTSTSSSRRPLLTTPPCARWWRMICLFSKTFITIASTKALYNGQCHLKLSFTYGWNPSIQISLRVHETDLHCL